jgi:NAD(P)-dependent dehydrogenase (short-subunit alcohol dehydrogenase family)
MGPESSPDRSSGLGNRVNKLALVTGGGGGLGSAICPRLARDGWRVVLTYLGDEEVARSVVAAIENGGGAALALRSDAASETDIATLYERIQSQFQAVPTLLVNNAGAQTWAPLLELAAADWDRDIRVNMRGYFLNTQAMARRVAEAGLKGSIVNIGSGCNKVPFPQLVAYTASKGGIEMLTKVSAIELGPLGVRVNCVAPGAIDIERTRRESPEYAQTWGAVTPLRRVGRPEDVAKAVAFLAGDESEFITGQTLGVDGGLFVAPNWPYAHDSALNPRRDSVK